MHTMCCHMHAGSEADREEGDSSVAAAGAQAQQQWQKETVAKQGAASLLFLELLFWKPAGLAAEIREEYNWRVRPYLWCRLRLHASPRSSAVRHDRILTRCSSLVFTACRTCHGQSGWLLSLTAIKHCTRAARHCCAMRTCSGTDCSMLMQVAGCTSPCKARDHDLQAYAR